MPSSTPHLTKHLNPKAPLVVDTHELGRSPGSMRELQRTIEAPHPIGIDVISIPEGAPIDLDIRLEAVAEGVLVSVHAVATALGECVRCLDPVTVPVDLGFQELYRYQPDPRNAPSKSRAEDPGDEDQLPSLVGELADLEPALVDAVVLELPFQPHCRPDCPGLCPECGMRLAENPGHHHEPMDARWQGLTSLVFEDSPSLGDTKRLSDSDPSQHQQEES